jgi:hypothetical protein
MNICTCMWRASAGTETRRNAATRRDIAVRTPRSGHSTEPVAAASRNKREKHPFNDKQSQIAERKTVGEQGLGDRSKEAA